VRLLEPQGTLFFLLLMVAFGALILWLALTKQIVFRVLAACLAFIPAMVFGIAAVNKYYDYYQTWGALFSDVSGQAQSTVPQLSAAGLGTGSKKGVLIGAPNAALDAQLGYLSRTTITGPRSHISRQVYIYLPPQYFSKAYAHYKFPAIELLHGSPGQPTTWIDVMNVIPIYLHLLAIGKAAPAVLVMPDTDGGQQYSLQCLNDPHGLQDMTYVGQEVPSWVAANLRVQRPGLMWGIAGYSEGGFCAANIALQYATRYGYAGVLSGYFAPTASQVPMGGNPGGRPHDVNVFAHNRQLLELNSPDKYVLHVPVGIQVPQFFLAAGSQDVADVAAAGNFAQLLQFRVAEVQPPMIVPGAGHQAKVWRTALTPMLSWMTIQLAQQVAHFTQVDKERAAAAAKAARSHAPKVPVKAKVKVKAPRTPSAHPTALSSALFRLK
jgi:enterochelin esterase-like enzyme